MGESVTKAEAESVGLDQEKSTARTEARASTPLSRQDFLDIIATLRVTHFDLDNGLATPRGEVLENNDFNFYNEIHHRLRHLWRGGR